MIALVLSMFAFAGTDIWSYSYKTEVPVAAYFEAVSSSLYISVNDSGKARLDKFSLDGKLLRTVASEEGAAGSLRSYDGKIYWLIGKSLYELQNSKSNKIRTYPFTPVDIAIDSAGKVFVALDNGEIWKDEKKIAEGGRVQGLLYYLDGLYFLRDGNLEKIGTKLSQKFCACSGLERASNGNWLASRGSDIFELANGKARKILEAGAAIGRIAYVYQMNEKDDFLLLPLSNQKQVKAIRIR